MKYYLVSADSLTHIINDQEHDIRMLDEGGKWTSLCGGYDSIEELKKDKEVLDDPCCWCGSPIKTTWREPVRSELIKQKVCFCCNIWLKNVKRRDHRNVVRVDHSHYVIGDNNATGYFTGHGGREFVIEFNDGRVVSSKNLWHQGTIPEHFREELPNNAKFV